MSLYLPSRRELLKAGTCGFGYLALQGLASQKAIAAPAVKANGFENPLAQRDPHFAPKAKRVIFMFMQGGPSQYETLEHSPELIQAAKAEAKGKGGAKAESKAKKNSLKGALAPRYAFKPAGESGLMISELFPHIAKHADDMCILNGMHTDSPAHPQASVMLHTGSINFVRPSLGAWVVYGLGSESDNLPGFVTISPRQNVGGAQNYGSSFLPAAFQGTSVGAAGNSLPNIQPANNNSQKRQLAMLQKFNREYRDRSEKNSEIDGVIQSYELAFRMQDSVPQVMDIASEPQAIRDMYGMEEKATANFGKQCLMARRLAESGVRYIQVNTGGWDQHNSLTSKIKQNCKGVDKPIAGLMTDLKRLGMLEDTLIVWSGEFGRTPQGQNADGRRHNNRGYSLFMAGGGVKGGMRFGATDPISGAAIEGRVHTHDLHATILHLMGLDHTKLTYKYAGRDFRLTDVYGEVVKEILV